VSDTQTTTAPPAIETRRRAPPLPYEGAGAKRLANTPPEPKRKRQRASTTSNWAVIRRHSEQRINLERSWRQSWMMHYQLLEAYLLPRRGIFINTAMPTPNSMNRGSPINENIIDPTGTYAARRCAAGIMSNEMSPSRQWFKLKPALFDRSEAPPEAIEWFEEVEDRMDTVMARSNFYQEAAQMFEDLVIFGTAPMIIYEDDEDLIRCYTPCCGEYFLASSSANRVGTMARLFVMTISAIVEMFGLENCPPEVQQMWKDKGGALEVEKLVAHMIEPNMAINAPGMNEDAGMVPGGFAWRESYWIWGASSEWPLSLAGFHDQPHLCPRWAVTSNDAYGRSVGMDVLPDVLQLQVMAGRLAEAQEKMLRPPMLASIDMKNEPASILPGKLTYVKGLGADVGMRPAYEIANPHIAEFAASITQKQTQTREGFFNDLFAMLEQVGKQMTAYEVAARNQEKLQVLGPVVERLQNEALAPAIKRVFRIMERKGLLPPLPPVLVGVPLGIEYVGVLALAQKAAKTASLERFAQVMNSQQQFHPEAADYWDVGEWAAEYSEELFLPKKIMRSKEQIAAIQQARAKQQQAAAQLQAASSMAKTAQTAGGIDLGGGQTAASMLTGWGGGAGAGAGLGGAPPQGSA
jgi:hypothetical protein